MYKFFRSIIWSHIFLLNIYPLAFLLKIKIDMWNYSETNFFTFFSNLTAFSFLSQIFYSSAIHFISIIILILYLFLLFSFFILLLYYFSFFSSFFFFLSLFFLHLDFFNTSLHYFLYSFRILVIFFLLQNKLLTHLWYLNFWYTFRGLGVI